VCRIDCFLHFVSCIPSAARGKALLHIFCRGPYMVPLGEGILLGDIREPDVEGKVFKAPNGKVTVYGRLSGSAIEPAGMTVLEQLAEGTLTTGRNEAIAAAESAISEADEEDSEPQAEEDE
jgi:hypothetical protein